MQDNISISAFVLMVSVMIVGFWCLAIERNSLINECEKNLPRTQHCHLIGVPNEQEHN
jgi:hypothetical protein